MTDDNNGTLDEKFNEQVRLLDRYRDLLYEIPQMEQALHDFQTKIEDARRERRRMGNAVISIAPMADDAIDEMFEEIMRQVDHYRDLFPEIRQMVLAHHDLQTKIEDARRERRELEKTLKKIGLRAWVQK